MRNFIISVSFLLLTSTSYLSASGFCSEHDCVAAADGIITEDSRSWFWNSYDRGSAKMNRVIFDNGTKVKFKVNYTYNHGSSGWAILEVYEGEFSCIRYHDFPNECRSKKKF